MEDDIVILAALTDIQTDWHRGVAYVGMARARTRLHVVIHEDCGGKRREREVFPLDKVSPPMVPRLIAHASPAWLLAHRQSIHDGRHGLLHR